MHLISYPDGDAQTLGVRDAPDRLGDGDQVGIEVARVGRLVDACRTESASRPAASPHAARSAA